MLLPLLGSAQPTDFVPAWKVVAQPQNEGQYLVRFSAQFSGGWQLYAPDQVLLDVPVVLLQFADSSIAVDPKIKFSPAATTVSSELFGQPVAIQQGQVQWEFSIQIKGPVPSVLSGQLFYTYGKGDIFYPSSVFSFQVPLQGGQSTVSIERGSLLRSSPLASCGDESPGNKSLLQIFLLGLLGGLIALLTPCVFPMVPVTVTYFTKRSVNRQAGILQAGFYGFFIFLIYVLITVPFHVAGNAISPEIFNNISTNVWLNLLFCVVFVAFALSFFGLYEIGLPASFANRTDARSGLGNVAGLFFMASTLAIVSFSCTGPILGTLLVGVVEQGAWPLTIGAAGFGLALGLPFALFALFPHWLQSLPRSGSWMTEFKVILGCVELALAIKFLSNADLVEQWGLVKREIFFGLWILIGFAMMIYLSGWKRDMRPAKGSRKPFLRWALIGLIGAFTLYMVPGLTNTAWADRKLISGFPPPLTYSVYSKEKTKAGPLQPLHNDYEQALQLARTQGKPILIDFTGWACVNCRRMEEKVWPDPRVERLMREEFVVLSLYVDERKKLPLTEQQVVSMPDGSTRTLVTVGDKWAHFQIKYFGATSQPQYAMITADEQILARPKFYTPDATEFADWLSCGLAAYRKLP
ncbi:MAG: protein-disulfide reductase DsbD family protein [Sphingomonadales bacterium]